MRALKVRSQAPRASEEPGDPAPVDAAVVKVRPVNRERLPIGIVPAIAAMRVVAVAPWRSVVGLRRDRLRSRLGIFRQDRRPRHGGRRLGGRCRRSGRTRGRCGWLSRFLGMAGKCGSGGEKESNGKASQLCFHRGIPEMLAAFAEVVQMSNAGDLAGRSISANPPAATAAGGC